jgi:tRNA(adenine34) deaminase
METLMTYDYDEQYMSLALEQAQRAFDQEEVPVGAIMVFDHQVVGSGRNAKERLKDPTAHAEMIAIREATKTLDRWRLFGCTLYVTLEPCAMCAGALISARVDRLVFGCSDPKAGAVVSLYSLLDDNRLNHRVEVLGGVLEEDATRMLKEFFVKRRSSKRDHDI